MTKFLKILLGIIIVIALVLIGGYFYLNTMMNREAKHGAKENEQIADVSKITEKQNIMFMGDSLTAGFNSDGKMSTENKGYRSVLEEQLKTQGVLGTEYNYAVGGYLIDDLLKQMDDDVTVAEVNEAMRNDNFSKELEKMYPTNLSASENPTISEAISKSNTLVLTIGANDVLTAVTYDEETQQMNIDTEKLLDTLKAVETKKADLFKQIHEINPDIKIYDVGIYMAYSFISEEMMQKVYPLLAYGESKIFTDDPKNNIYRVTVRDNMQANLQSYVDNPNDIHPNYEGYKIMGNEILKAMAKN